MTALDWLNKEKAAFLAASAWLLLCGAMYSFAPEVRRWGQPRTNEPPPKAHFLNIKEPNPMGEYLVGARPDPWHYTGRPAALRSLPGVAPPPPIVVDRGKKPPKEQKPPPPKPIPKPKAVVAEKPKPYELPARLAGRLAVGGGKGLTVFQAKESGEYVAVKEGDELPGLGVKVVRATKNIVIVENEKGQRFRLTDLLRARAAEEGAAEER